MRIAVLGAGAIGSVLGGLLVKQGHDVTLVARQEQVDAVRAHGLRIDGCLGPLEIPIHATRTLESAPDLVLLAVKTQDVPGALQEHRAHLEGVPIVTLQNGVRSDALVAASLPGAEIVSAVVVVTATYLEPARVTLVERGYLVVGRPPCGPRDALVDRVASVLGAAVPTQVSDNVAGAHWLKLLLNLNNALPALTDEPMGELSGDPFFRGLAIRLMREGLRAVDSARIPLESLGNVTVRQVRFLTRLPTTWAARAFGRQVRGRGGPWPVLGSTLQSLRRGRTTEIDFLNGEIVSLGRGIGMPTPLNARVVELVHEVERTRHFYRPEELRAIIGGSVRHSA